MSTPETILGPAEMGNVQVGNPNMRAAIEADAERWAAIAAAAIDKVSTAKNRLADGTNDRGTEDNAPAVAAAGKPPPLTIPELVAQLLREDLISLKRNPTDWEVRTITFDNTSPKLIAGRRALRETIVIFNASATVTYAVSQAALLQNTNQVGTIVVGAALSIDTEGSFWGTAAVGTTLDVIETYWDVTRIAEAVAEIAAHISTRIQPTV